mmetsp:Transcript_3023/g.5119  ORF Transcript_3023/g.5119 Transcript_3023/m.5119 type:complete len:81 (-) Transcript_3023:106-348(-)
MCTAVTRVFNSCRLRPKYAPGIYPCGCLASLVSTGGVPMCVPSYETEQHKMMYRLYKGTPFYSLFMGDAMQNAHKQNTNK